jgi:hypothetical protein
MPVPGGDRSVVLRIPAVSFILSLCQTCLLFETAHAGHEVFDERITLGLVSGQDVHAAPEVAHVRMGVGQFFQHILLYLLHYSYLTLHVVQPFIEMPLCFGESLGDHCSQIIKGREVFDMLRHMP